MFKSSLFQNKFFEKHIKLLMMFLSMQVFAIAQPSPRTFIDLNKNWKTIADSNIHKYQGFENKIFNTAVWETVNVPHNWDKYEGYRRLLHGNRHGYAWYRKSFKINGTSTEGKKYFLAFEGVGSYATVWLNGINVGHHAGGRTTFTLDITKAVKLNQQENILAVRADHPADSRDLPWVDGGDSPERGFSEGSQPMGIFRPVHLIITNDLRIQPFGVHIWNDDKVTAQSATLNLETELKNYNQQQKKIKIIQLLVNEKEELIASDTLAYQVLSGQTRIVKQELTNIHHVKLWSLENPYLYTLVTKILENGKVIDQLRTSYGIRWISWPIGDNSKDPKRFLLNGKPVFINGIAEYEHMIGASHAFSDEHIRSRVMQIKAAGFNAFRDAHQPHNLLYQKYWDQLGILSWTQMAAHIWFDNPSFRENFKKLLADWVKERRNSPSVVLWGLENESTLPEDFAIECSNIIRKLDPTASSQRKITTCNGGKGTDWDVPQNWTGTYGGNPLTYGEDLKRQQLVGEYGAWRTIDLHTEGPFNQNGAYSEERISQLMETKIRLADSVKNEVAGHFFWLYNSHDNPGRVQGGEGLRELDRIGPVNYKGLLTPWEEPLDVYYMFRANYAPKEKEPMVYIVSHTWPNRWDKQGIKDSIVVYSNCDSVALFNDIDAGFLGFRKNNGIGHHFQWDHIDIKYNILYAKGYVNGKVVAKDTIVLQNLPKAPNFKLLYSQAKNLTVPKSGYNYLYRVNCGGADYVDINGNTWLADRNRKDKSHWGSTSWTQNFEGIPAFFASQRRSFDPIKGSKDWKLFQDFRYGLNELKFHFPVSDGEYLVELYFNEPWLGTGGGMDCKGWRLFDVAVNNQTVIDDLDIWKDAGHDGALKKTVKAAVKGGELVISFPEAKAGQAIISGIAIATLDPKIIPAESSSALMQNLSVNGEITKSKTWLDIGNHPYQQKTLTLTELPSNLYGAEWIQTSGDSLINLRFTLEKEADVFVGIKGNISLPKWLKGYEDYKAVIKNSLDETFKVYRKRFQPSDEILINALPANAYVVAAVPASSLQPAFDLKTVTNYKAFETKIQKGVKKQVLMNQDRLIFEKDSSQIIFEIKTGVADVYSLTLKYHNPFETAKMATIEVKALDGTVLKAKETIALAPTKEGKWNYVNSSTGTMINAGTYSVIISSVDANGVSVDALDVQ